MFFLDEEYSKLMLTEGNDTPISYDGNEMELPEWADEKQIKM
jgi:hypothetical protein